MLRDRWELHSAFGLGTAELRAWLAWVESSYRAGCHYHTATHAADVLQTAHHLLAPGGAGGARALGLDELSVLALLLAAMVRDVLIIFLAFCVLVHL